MRYFLILVVVLSGCVTTTTGKVGAPPELEEAARLNLDLGISYLRQGDIEQARAKLEKSIQEQPDNPTAHRALGMVYERIGELDGAEAQYRMAVKQAPKDPDAIEQLAIFLCLHGDSGEALELFQDAVAVPMNARRYIVYTNAGTCAKRDDNLVLAETYLRQALAAKPTYPTALLQIADVAFRQENYLQSRAFIERYLAEEPAIPSLLWLAFQVEIKLGSAATADKLGRQLLTEFPTSVEARQLLEYQRNAQ